MADRIKYNVQQWNCTHHNMAQYIHAMYVYYNNTIHTCCMVHKINTYVQYTTHTIQTYNMNIPNVHTIHTSTTSWGSHFALISSSTSKFSSTLKWQWEASSTSLSVGGLAHTFRILLRTSPRTDCAYKWFQLQHLRNSYTGVCRCSTVLYIL